MKNDDFWTGLAIMVPLALAAWLVIFGTVWAVTR